MKQETQSVVSFRRHLTLWWRRWRSPGWVGVTVVHVGATAYFWYEGFIGAALVASLGQVVAQIGLWFAVGERYAREMRGGKDLRE